ncbi:Traf2 and NCK-interacting protein kinase [Rhodotorula toruloides]|nr:Traf2 and NCK-interacting protein kinase [Rhodotorula toruloides]
MALPPLPDDFILKRSTVDSVKPIVQRLVETDDLQTYLSRRPLQRNPSPTHDAAGASPPPLSPVHLSPPPAIESPLLAGLSSASKTSENEIRFPRHSDIKYSGAITELDSGDSLFRDLTSALWEELDKLKVWHGDIDLPPCEPYFLGRTEHDVERFVASAQISRAVQVLRGILGVPVYVAGPFPSSVTGSVNLVILIDGYIGGRVVQVRLEVKRPEMGPPAVFEALLAYGERRAVVQMAAELRPDWGTTDVADEKVDLAISDPPPSLSDPPPSPASPTSSPSSFVSSATVAGDEHACLRGASQKIKSVDHHPPSDSPTLAVPTISGVLDSSGDDHPSDSDYRESGSDTDSRARSVGPANSATRSPAAPVSRKGPRPKDWAKWSITDGGTSLGYQQLNRIGRHTLLFLQQLGTQFGEEVWKAVTSEEQEKLKQRSAQETKGRKGRKGGSVQGKASRVLAEEDIRPHFLSRIAATTDSQMLITPANGLPFLRIGNKLHVGPSAKSHGDVSLQLVILCLLDLGKALGLEGGDLAGRLRTTFAKISSANHLPTLSPKASSASPATSTQHTTDSTAAPPPSASNRSSAAVTDHASDAGDSSFGSTSEKMLDDVSFDVIQGGDPLDEIASPVSSTHPSPKRSPLVAPKDTIKRSQGILIDGHEFVAPGASGVASFLEVVLEDELGSGAGGNVYTDPSGTLAIKVIVPRDADSEEQYEERWDEGVQEVKALKHLEGCAAAPELYGVFVRTDEQGYKWMVIVSERIRGKRCRLGDFKKYRLKIACALMSLHSRKVLHDDVRPPNVLITDNLGIKFVDFGRALLNPTLEQCHWEMYRFTTCAEE